MSGKYRLCWENKWNHCPPSSTLFFQLLFFVLQEIFCWIKCRSRQEKLRPAPNWVVPRKIPWLNIGPSFGRKQFDVARRQAGYERKARVSNSELNRIEWVTWLQSDSRNLRVGGDQPWQFVFCHLAAVAAKKKKTKKKRAVKIGGKTPTAVLMRN